MDSEAPAKKSLAGRRIWAVLLIVDGLFVVIFGGALAAKVYQHVSAPLQMANIPAPKRPKPPEPAPKLEPEEAKPESPADRALTRGSAASEGRKEAAKAPEPKKAKTPPAAAKKAVPETKAVDAKAAKPKAEAVRFKLKAPSAKSVKLAGAFIMRGGKKDMARDNGGEWAATVYLLPGKTYRYSFIVDGKKTLDPDNPKTERGASVLALP